MRFLLRLMLFVVTASIAIALYASLRTPGHLYRSTGVFADCPPRPSCVSSVAANDVHRIEALRYEDDSLQAQARLVTAVRQMPGSRLEEERADYLHVVFVSPRMRLRDDLELLIEQGGQIQVRSISRFGYDDRGANRARVEALRAIFMNSSAP